MRIMHVSDTHGKFAKPLVGNFDLIIHTGDFFPNSNAIMIDDKDGEALWQLKWLDDNIEEITQWAVKKPMLFVLGNHDFVDPQKMQAILNDHGMKSWATEIHDRIVMYNDFYFYGFPYVHSRSDKWNYRREGENMKDEVRKMFSAIDINGSIDVIVCHGPLAGILDLCPSGDRCGNSYILNYLKACEPELAPSLMLHGHIHESHGVTTELIAGGKQTLLISNAATAQHIIEIK